MIGFLNFFLQAQQTARKFGQTMSSETSMGGFAQPQATAYNKTSSYTSSGTSYASSSSYGGSSSSYGNSSSSSYGAGGYGHPPSSRNGFGDPTVRFFFFFFVLSQKYLNSLNLFCPPGIKNELDHNPPVLMSTTKIPMKEANPSQRRNLRHLSLRLSLSPKSRPSKRTSLVALGPNNPFLLPPPLLPTCNPRCNNNNLG